MRRLLIIFTLIILTSVSYFLIRYERNHNFEKYSQEHYLVEKKNPDKPRLPQNYEIDKNLVLARINSSINYVDTSYKTHGYFKTDQCRDSEMLKFCNVDKVNSLFTIAIISNVAMNIEPDKMSYLLKNTTELFLSQQGKNGFWEFYFNDKNKKHGRYYFPDLDDSSLIGFFLSKQKVEFNELQLKKTIMEKQIKDGLFLTFLKEYQPPFSHYMNIDPVINANTMMFLHKELFKSCEFINNFVKNDKVSSYYPDQIVFFYMLSEPYFNKITCLKEPLNSLSLKLKNKYIKDEDVKIDSVMKLSLFTTALIKSGNADKNMIKMLLYKLIQIRQTNDKWGSEFFFHGGDEKTDFYYGSPELSALFYAEALQLCYKFIWNN